MLWYVVQVRTGEERDIAAKLTDMGFQTLAPWRTVRSEAEEPGEQRSMYCSPVMCSSRWITMPEIITG